MQTKTKGIVISYIKYSETSIIAKIFTEKYGIQSFMINGVRSKSSKNKIALFQPLTQLEIVLNYKESKNIQRLTEVKCTNLCLNIIQDFYKSCIALFISELLQKITLHQDTDKELFGFLTLQIKNLEKANKNESSWIPIYFLLGLCKVQGFLPMSIHEISSQLDFNQKSNFKKYNIQIELAIHSIIVENKLPIISSELKKELFQYLLYYYKQMIGNFGELKSLQVLKEIIN